MLHKEHRSKSKNENDKNESEKQRKKQNQKQINEANEKEIERQKWWAKNEFAIILSTLLAILLFALSLYASLYTAEAKKILEESIRSIKEGIGLASISVANISWATLGGLLVFIINRRAITRISKASTELGLVASTLESKLSNLQLSYNKKGTVKRWGDIKQVKASRISNPPLCYWEGEQGHSEAMGLGPDFLKFALPQGCTLIADSSVTTWANVIADIVAGRDGCRTSLCPLYETFERNRDVIFSAPLYYADVGIYVNAKLYKRLGGKKLKFHEAIEYLRDQNGLCFASIKGEISGKLSGKYADEAKDDIFDADAYLNETTALTEVLADDGKPCNIAFFECFHADNTDVVKHDGSVINLLEPRELLYPVGFIFRREDYVLRNLINLKIIEARDQKSSCSPSATPLDRLPHPSCSTYEGDWIHETLKKHIMRRRHVDAETAAMQVATYFVTEHKIHISGEP